jgi:curved DNA-binding protein CbpA
MNYYEILGTKESASQEDIVQAFRKLAKIYHPDLNKEFDAKINFIRVFEAYSLLKDEEKRKIYDDMTFGRGRETDENKFNSWNETAQEEAEYYSGLKYKIFAEKVLKNVVAAAKFSKKILGFFALMITFGIAGMIIQPTLNYGYKKVIEAPEERIKIQDKETKLPLPLYEPKEGWTRIYINDLGSIDIPPTMEVQGGPYKEIWDPIKKQIGFNTDKLTIQQKGLSLLEKDGFQKYARVIIGTEVGRLGDFNRLDFNIEGISTSEIKELNSILKASVIDSFKGTGLKLTEWLPINFEKINGMSCIRIGYIRQLNNNPTVMVNIFQFHNNDRMHKLTLSYRISETAYWKKDYEIILDSFRITIIK